MKLEENIAQQLARMMESKNFATPSGLEAALRLLAKWRSLLIDNTVVNKDGVAIQAGPFAGMKFVRRSGEASLSPKLLGTYEGEIHELIEEVCASSIESIIDIGCADGYYAVGFAYRMPNVKVYAYDISEEAQKKCSDLAASNDVSDRITVSGEFKGSDFENFSNQRTLVFMDAEGLEDQMLRPDLYDPLRNMQIFVECHDIFIPKLSHRIEERFRETHSIVRVNPHLQCGKLPSWFSGTSHLDQLLAIWEWRLGPTPWLFMKPRKG